MKKTYFIFFLFLLCISCGGRYKTKDVDQKNGFYFWKTRGDFSQEQCQQLDSFNTKVIYLRLFDVGWDKDREDVVPLGELRWYNSTTSPYAKYEVVPTVFITNESFKNIQEGSLDQFANRVYNKILLHFSWVAESELSRQDYNYYNEPYFQTSADFKELVKRDSLAKHYFTQVKEFQFDCDWTESTKAKYFKFLTIMKSKLSGKTISVTIRLYPYKYPDKAGVPPVDKGMLMCYNMGDVTNMGSGNSIFDKKEAFKYLKTKKDYPLILDYAFPAFEWYSVYHEGKLVKLVDIEDIYLDDSRFKDVSEKGVKKFEVIDGHEVYGYDLKLQKGDIVKVESLPFDDIVTVASYISSRNKNKNPRVVIFDYDPNSIRRNEKSIQKIFNCF